MNQVKPGHCALRLVIPPAVSLGIGAAGSGAEPAVGASHGPFCDVCRKMRIF